MLQQNQERLEQLEQFNQRQDRQEAPYRHTVSGGQKQGARQERTRHARPYLQDSRLDEAGGMSSTVTVFTGCRLPFCALRLHLCCAFARCALFGSHYLGLRNSA